jgi:hypothetical protein
MEHQQSLCYKRACKNLRLLWLPVLLPLCQQDRLLLDL